MLLRNHVAHDATILLIVVIIKTILSKNCKMARLHKRGGRTMSTMYSLIEELCRLRSINMTEMCTGAGISRGSLTDLKNGRIHTLKAETLAKIADYFDVTVDYILGRTGVSKKPIPEEIGFDDFTYAMHGETKELTDAQKQQLLTMARFLKHELEKEKGNE